MSAFSGVQGYENLSSAEQKDRGAGSLADNGFARRPAAPPSHLPVVVSVPPQSNADFRGSLHDVGAEYKHAVNSSPMGSNEVIDALMGSRLYMIRLSTMKKAVEAMGSETAKYAVASKLDGSVAKLTLQQRGYGNDIIIDVSDGVDDYSLSIGGQVTAVRSSFPVPDSVSSAGKSQHPYYTFTNGDEKNLQWQIEPLETGPLRYTLVQFDSATASADDVPKPENIRAIYHYIGQAPSLSLCNGEGVLLLPEDGGSTEALIVASLLGLLWRVRAMQVKPPPMNSAKPEKKPILRRFF